MSFFLIKSAYLIALLYSLLPPVVLHERSLCDMITRLRLGREIVLGVLPSVNLQFFVKKEGWGETEGGLIYREGGY